MECENQTWRQGARKAAIAGLQARDHGGPDQLVAMRVDRSRGIWGCWGGNK